MKTLYFDCQSGISGDMTVGALLDLGVNGVDVIFLARELDKLKLNNFKIETSNVVKKGIKATKFDVLTSPENVQRNLDDINRIINESTLSAKVKKAASDIFLTLATAEAVVHETRIEEVHFHEVGAIDSIIDIVSVAILLEALNIERVICGKITEGSGKVKMVHGEFELPVPAVRELLREIDINIVSINKELVTPTGAAIIKTITDEFADKLEVDGGIVGCGAGTRDLDIANVLRVHLCNF